MARIARVVVPDIPHHIIQRGNRRQKVFFSDDDRRAYLDYLRIYAKPAGISIWAYCLMDNHVHLIAVPKYYWSFAEGFSRSHWKYTRRVNFIQGWRGYLWEGRFKSFPLAETHLYAAMRYVERNPVRAKMIINAWDYSWSSALAHANKDKDLLLDNNFVIDEIDDWKGYLSGEDNKNDLYLFRHHTGTSRPLGNNGFIKKLEKITGRILGKQKPGPKKKENN